MFWEEIISSGIKHPSLLFYGKKWFVLQRRKVFSYVSKRANLLRNNAKRFIAQSRKVFLRGKFSFCVQSPFNDKLNVRNLKGFTTFCRKTFGRKTFGRHSQRDYNCWPNVRVIAASAEHNVGQMSVWPNVFWPNVC